MVSDNAYAPYGWESYDNRALMGYGAPKKGSKDAKLQMAYLRYLRDAYKSGKVSKKSRRKTKHKAYLSTVNGIDWGSTPKGSQAAKMKMAYLRSLRGHGKVGDWFKSKFEKLKKKIAEAKLKERIKKLGKDVYANRSEILGALLPYAKQIREGEDVSLDSGAMIDLAKKALKGHKEGRATQLLELAEQINDGL